MSLSTPQQVQARLEELENDLAIRQNAIEAQALAWFRKKRDREKQWAEAYVRAEGPAHVRKAEADLAVATVGVIEEAEYEAGKAVMRVLETRASIGQSLLRSQGRG